MDQLAFDLLLYVHEPDVCALLVRIEARIDENSLPMVENGVLKCHIEEVIHGVVTEPNLISLRYSRMKDNIVRAKSSVNHWNALSLEDGDRLLIVCKPTDDAHWKALSGNQVASATDPTVLGLKECYRIQGFEKNSSEHKSALRAGLVTDNALTRRYSLEAISKHEVVPRAEGCAMIVDVLKTEQPDRNLLLRFADALSSIPFFDEDKKADDVNQAVVVGLATIIERLEEPRDRVTCVRYLASCVLVDFDPEPKKDNEMRSALLKAIDKAPPKLVAETIADMMSSQLSDDKNIATELNDAWLAAM